MGAHHRALLLSGMFVTAFFDASRLRANDLCSLTRFASLPVTITGNKKLILPVTLNGKTIRAFIDTGSATTMLAHGVAKEMRLSMHDLKGERHFGIGGEVASNLAIIRELKFGSYSSNYISIPTIPDMTGGKKVYDIVIGGDVLHSIDLDIDLAGGKINFFSHNHCEGQVVYWADRALSYPFRLSDINRIELKARLNGEEMWSTLDTGAPTTLLSWAAANRIGLTTDTPGLEPAGRIMGYDGKKVESWETRINSVEIGDELMQNYPILIANTKRSSGAPLGSHINDFVYSANILIGTEFFQLNHVYIAYSENRIYYTPYSAEQRRAVILRIGSDEKVVTGMGSSTPSSHND